MTYLRPQPLVFPRGVRFPRDDEFPAGHDSDRERIRRANVTTGFVLRDHHSQSFAAYFEANVHAPSLFEVFRDLALANFQMLLRQSSA